MSLSKLTDAPKEKATRRPCPRSQRGNHAAAASGEEGLQPGPPSGPGALDPPAPARHSSGLLGAHKHARESTRAEKSPDVRTGPLPEYSHRKVLRLSLIFPRQGDCSKQKRFQYVNGCILVMCQNVESVCWAQRPFGAEGPSTRTSTSHPQFEGRIRQAQGEDNTLGLSLG